MGPRRPSLTSPVHIFTQTAGGAFAFTPSADDVQTAADICVRGCFYYSHCGPLSPTLVAYAGGGSLSSS